MENYSDLKAVWNMDEAVCRTIHSTPFDFCSERCKKEMKKVWEDRAKKRVCVNCGSDDIDGLIKKQEKPICKKCKATISALLTKLDELHEQIDYNMKNGRNRSRK